MGKPLRVLIVEDSEDDTLLIVRELQRGGYSPSFERVDTADAMNAALKKQTWDVVIADYVMPHFSGPDALKLLQESGRDLPFIVVSGKIGEDTAVAAMKAGAHDYIMKNNMTRLPAAVERELQEAENRRKRRQADEALRKAYEELEIRVEERTRDLAEANAELLVEVAERELTEKRLRESEQKLKTILENTRDVIFQLSPLGIIQYVSPRVKEIYGYRVEDLIGENLSKITPVDELPKTLEALGRVLFGEELTVEINQLDSEGNIVPVEVNATPVGRDGKIVAVQCVMRDLTERKRAEEALRESEQFNSSLLTNSPCPILVINPDTSIKYVNPALEKLTGFASAGLIGKKAPYPWLTEESLPRTIGDFQVAMRTGKKWFEELFQKKSQEPFWVEITSAPIRHNGELRYYMENWVDITERKKMEEERQRAMKLESVGILAGGIAHDFNNLLTGVIGNIGLAKRYVEPGGKAFDRLLEAEKASLRARDLTQQLLTFAKGGKPIKKTISITELIKDSANFAVRGSNVRCEFFLPDDLWGVEADEGQMNQVISNLVINADEAMPEGGIINISARNIVIQAGSTLPLRQGSYVEISIEDHGIGIMREHLQKIFDPYFTTKRKGDGLGLATTYSIIKNHNGYITLDSVLGVGTTFYIYLPASRKPVTVKEEPAEDPPIKGMGRVLVMDDEEIVRELLLEELSESGYEVELTTDGVEAIEQYAKAKKSGKPFDAVILDMTVPGGMGGKEAVKKLLEIDPEVEAIVCSGYANDSIMVDFRDYGFRAAIAKPYRIIELEKTLHSVVTGRGG